MVVNGTNMATQSRFLFRTGNDDIKVCLLFFVAMMAILFDVCDVLLVLDDGCAEERL